MRFDNLDAWLAWQETLNPSVIDLGLERIEQVMQRADYSHHFDCPLIMVAGTNGKGSVVALLEAMASAAGYRVCSYTSPHILNYNERIKIAGVPVSNKDLCDAFDRIDQARADIRLTYFEFGTLAAIDLFQRARPELVIMEIGLGGRLDAVNVMQPDVSVITPIAIDHADWLGDNREDIAREKAGIFRHNKPAICIDTRPPATLMQLAEQLSVKLAVLGRDFTVENDQPDRLWKINCANEVIGNLPQPALIGRFQKNNAAAAIMALQSLESDLSISHDAICQGLKSVRLKGRFEIVNQQPEVIVDVAHNPHAVMSLVEQLKIMPVGGKTHLVIAMLEDKPVDEVVELLLPVVDNWYTAGFDDLARGLPSVEMSTIVAGSMVDHAVSNVKLSQQVTVESAIEAALNAADINDRIVITGSFYTVAVAIRYFHNRVGRLPVST